MVTTALAIYGSSLSTASTVLGAWYFLRSGPRLQASANVYPEADEEGCPSDDEWSITLKVWNTGRSEVTIDIEALQVHYNGKAMHIVCPVEPGGSNGPKVPTRIQAHSGETWYLSQFDLATMAREPVRKATISVLLIVGGNREMTVPVWDGWHRKKERPFVLKTDDTVGLSNAPTSTS